MKKQILLSLFIIFSITFLQAKTVELQKAVNVAAGIIGINSTHSRMSTSVAPINGLILAKSASPASNYYIFNDSDGSGFVIVSGDDAAKPILGYSDEGTYNGNNQPPAFVYWLNFLNDQILYAVQNDLPTNPEWENFTAENFTTTQLLSTKWDQGNPYNNMCPQILNGHAVTGCVATAMAQIMKYHEHPAQGKGSTTAYVTPTDGVSMPAINLSLAAYDWINMLNSYPSDISGVPTVQQNAVAQLMYHCGTSIQMDYDLNGSGAYSIDVAYALVNHFDYDPGILFEMREYYSDDEWENFLTQQIDAGLPVLYSGVDRKVGGHTFVCDGYNAAGLFHFNWGWSGYYNGYYVTSAVNPADYSFSNKQNILINIKPNENGEAVPEMVMWPDTDMFSATTRVSTDSVFDVRTSCLNIGFATFVGYVGIALVDDDDNILAILGKYAELISLSAEYGGISIDIQVKVPENIPSGEYKMKTVAIKTDTVIMLATTGDWGELPLKVDCTVGCHDASIDEIENQELFVYPNPVEDIIHISGEEVLAVEIKDLSGLMIKQSNETDISVEDLQSGNYILVIQTKNGIITRKILKK